MSQPTPYTPTTDFSQQEANNASGRSTVNTAALDAEFANIESTLDSVVSNIGIIQRDDGYLADSIVTVPALSRDVLSLLGGFVNRGDWLTATAYAVNDLVTQSGYLYQCATAHTSGVFLTDAANWIKFGFGPSDGVAAATAQAAIDAHLIDTTDAHDSTAISHGAGSVSEALDTLNAQKAALASPAFTGTPTAPTATSGDSSSQLANTAFVANAVASVVTGGATLSSLGAIFNSSVAKTGAYTVVAGDKGKIISCSGTWSLALTGAATLGDGFAFAVANTGSGDITIDPNSTETIDAVSTLVVAAGKSVIVVCDGTKFVTFGRGGVESFNTRTGPVTLTSGDVTTALGFTPPSSLVVSEGAVGSYMFALAYSYAPTFGGTISGANLYPSAVRPTINGGGESSYYGYGNAQGGTWKCLGYCASATYQLSLFQRIA